MAESRSYGDFVELLTGLQPSRTLFALVRDMFEQAWEMFRKNADLRVTDHKVEVAKLEDFQKQLEAENQKLRQSFEKRRLALVKRQRAERRAFREKIKLRHMEENKVRQQRFRRGIKDLWDRLRGEHKRIAAQNVREAEAAYIRDRRAWDGLVFHQLSQRKQLQLLWAQLRDRTRTLSRDLQKDVQMFRGMRLAEEPRPKRKRRRTRNRGPTPER